MFSSILERDGSRDAPLEGGHFVHILRPDLGRTRLWDGSGVKIADEGELAGVELAEG